MISIHGVFDGEVARPLEPVQASANSPVVITFLESSGQKRNGLLDKLEQEGLIYSRPLRARTEPRNFEPVPIQGAPLSQTIIEDRGDL